MAQPLARPGYGDKARIKNPQSGSEWYGPVRYWGSTGCPLLSDELSGQTRWFPPDWVATIEPGSGAPACSCSSDPEMPPDKLCAEHGDSTAVRNAAKRGEL